MATIKTRDEVRDRVLQRTARENDSTTSTLAEELIEEAIREIEGTHPFPWSRARASRSIAQGQKSDVLPPRMITHFPFTAKIVKVPISGNPIYQELVKMEWQEFEEGFLVPDTIGKPQFYSQTGMMAAQNFEYELYPVPDTNYRIDFVGYFYTDTAGWSGTDFNWLTENAPMVVVELVASMVYQHYGEPAKAAEAYQNYLILLNGDTQRGTKGLIQKAKMQETNRRQPRLKVYGEASMPIGKRYYGS